MSSTVFEKRSTTSAAFSTPHKKSKRMAIMLPSPLPLATASKKMRIEEVSKETRVTYNTEYGKQSTRTACVSSRGTHTSSAAGQNKARTSVPAPVPSRGPRTTSAEYKARTSTPAPVPSSGPRSTSAGDKAKTPVPTPVPSRQLSNLASHDKGLSTTTARVPSTTSKEKERWPSQEKRSAKGEVRERSTNTARDPSATKEGWPTRERPAAARTSNGERKRSISAVDVSPAVMEKAGSSGAAKERRRSSPADFQAHQGVAPTQPEPWGCTEEHHRILACSLASSLMEVSCNLARLSAEITEHIPNLLRGNGGEQLQASLDWLERLKNISW